MRILADKVIAEAAPAFAAYGDVELFDGRMLDNNAVQTADILLIRSVTPVDEKLLARSSVKFVGTATAGVDHVDQAALGALGIPFASAPGCNANAVAEFVATSVLGFCLESEIAPKDVVVAIIGHGQVGTRVETKLTSLGFKCVLNDPPKASAGETGYVDLDTALQADIVTLHTPLTVDGDYPSINLIDAAALNHMKSCRLLINAARGGIVDETALLRRLNRDHNFNVQIDCWRGEPMIDLQLLAKAYRCSPHVAGHTIEARRKATRQLATVISEWSGIENPWLCEQAADNDNAESLEHLVGQDANESTDALLSAMMGYCCPIGAIDNATRALIEQGSDTRGQYFDQLRREVGGRREFSFYKLPIAVCGAVGQNTVDALGFRC